MIQSLKPCDVELFFGAKQLNQSSHQKIVDPFGAARYVAQDRCSVEICVNGFQDSIHVSALFNESKWCSKSELTNNVGGVVCCPLLEIDRMTGICHVAKL